MKTLLYLAIGFLFAVAVDAHTVSSGAPRLSAREALALIVAYPLMATVGVFVVASRAVAGDQDVFAELYQRPVR